MLRYSPRSSLQLSIVLPSLLLRARIFSSIFEHHWCYAPRFSLQLAKFYNDWCYALRISYIDLHRFSLYLSTVLPSLLLPSKIFTEISYPHGCYFIFFVKHHWCGALRSSVQLSNIMVSTFLDLLFKFLPSLMLGRACLQFANMVDATLQNLLFNFQTFYYHWCYAPTSFLQCFNIMDATGKIFS